MWNQSITTLAGVGNETGHKLHALGIHRIIDAALTMPTKIMTRTLAESSALIPPSEVIITLSAFRIAPRNTRIPLSHRNPLKIYAECCWGSIEIVYFRGRESFYTPYFRTDNPVIAVGTLTKQGNKLSLIHPLIIRDNEMQIYMNQPIYPLTYGLTQTRMRTVIRNALGVVRKTLVLQEYIPQRMLQDRQWPSFFDALMTLHNPHEYPEIERQHAEERLAFDEMCAFQMQFTTQEAKRLSRPAPALAQHSLAEKLVQSLPFTLTHDQQAAIRDIQNDVTQSHPMLRLLQGDVGSGKTIVALYALVRAAENGFLGCILVPTEILAKQHLNTMSALAEPLGISVYGLTGKTTSKQRAHILQHLESGGKAILIGTHALLFQQQALFTHMGCLVIDEQHRFGVQQRLTLLQNPHMTAHCLLMSATPIPRTQRLMQFGQIAVSEIRHKPANRKPITTTLLSSDRLHEFIPRLYTMLEKGHKAYWVCPLIEESETLEAAAATMRFEELTRAMPAIATALIHGKTPVKDRDAALSRFKKGETHLLVSTTVIEVGIDVPDATILIIDNAERFGLSQLHQLRGRIGRGHLESYCILMYDKLNPTARERLNIMRTSDDGFTIAEADLHLRDGGNILGTQQSGKHLFRYYTFDKHKNFLTDVTTTLRQTQPNTFETLSQIFLPHSTPAVITAAG